MAELHVSDQLFAVINDPDVQRVVVEGTIDGGLLAIEDQYTLAAPPNNLVRGDLDIAVTDDALSAIIHLDAGHVDGTIHLFFVKDGDDPDTKPDVFADFWFEDVDPAGTPPTQFGQTLVLEG